MTINEVISLYPETIDIFLEYGLHCFACGAAVYETIEEGMMAHDMNESDVNDMINDLNDLINK